MLESRGVMGYPLYYAYRARRRRRVRAPLTPPSTLRPVPHW